MASTRQGKGGGSFEPPPDVPRVVRAILDECADISRRLTAHAVESTSSSCTTTTTTTTTKTNEGASAREKDFWLDGAASRLSAPISPEVFIPRIAEILATEPHVRTPFGAAPLQSGDTKNRCGGEGSASSGHGGEKGGADPLLSHAAAATSPIDGCLLSLARSLEELAAVTSPAWVERVSKAVDSSNTTGNSNGNNNGNGSGSGSGSGNVEGATGASGGNDGAFGGNDGGSQGVAGALHSLGGELPTSLFGEHDLGAQNLMQQQSGGVGFGDFVAISGTDGGLELPGWTRPMGVCRDVSASLLDLVEEMRKGWNDAVREAALSAIPEVVPRARASSEDADGSRADPGAADAGKVRSDSSGSSSGTSGGGVASRGDGGGGGNVVMVPAFEHAVAARLLDAGDRRRDAELSSLEIEEPFVPDLDVAAMARGLDEVAAQVARRHAVLEKHEAERRWLLSASARGAGPLRTVIKRSKCVERGFPGLAEARGEAATAVLVAAALALEHGIPLDGAPYIVPRHGAAAGAEAGDAAGRRDDPAAKLVVLFGPSLEFLAWGARVLVCTARSITASSPTIIFRHGSGARPASSGPAAAAAENQAVPTLQEAASSLSGGVDLFAELARAVLASLDAALSSSFGLGGGGGGTGAVGFAAGATAGAGGGFGGGGGRSRSRTAFPDQGEEAAAAAAASASGPAAGGTSAGDKDAQATDLLVARGCKERVIVPVDNEGDVIRWSIRVMANDIGFEIAHVSMNMCNIDGTIVEQADILPVVAYSRKNAAQGWIRGEYTADHKGDHALVFDNSYALMTDKIIRYHWEIESSQAEEDLPFYLRKPATHERTRGY